MKERAIIRKKKRGERKQRVTVEMTEELEFDDGFVSSVGGEAKAQEMAQRHGRAKMRTKLIGDCLNDLGPILLEVEAHSTGVAARALSEVASDFRAKLDKMAGLQ